MALLAPAPARADTPPPVETTIAGPRFVVHYMTGGDPTTVPQITPQAAQAVLTDAEAAYSFYVERLGFPAPIGDNAMTQLPGRRTVRVSGMRWATPWWDGKIDIYVARLSGGVLGRAIPGTAAVSTTPGMFMVDYRATPRTTAHELFHLIQFAIFRRATLDILLGEGMANWGAYQFLARSASTAANPPPALGAVGPGSLRLPWSSLDCRSNCGAGNRRGGYDQWPFFQFLSEHYGSNLIKEILNRSAALGARDRKPHGFESISGVLREQGSSLAEAFAAYTASRLDGNFGHPLLAGKTMTVNGKLVPVRRKTRTARLVVNHLAARALLLRVRGKSTCTTRRVRVSFSSPSGVSARLFVVQLGGRSRTLESNRGHIHLVANLRPCSPGARLAVANLSPNPAGDGKVFTVAVRALRSKRR